MENKPGIVKQCEYVINFMGAIRKNLIDVGAKDREITWAIGSIYIALIGRLISILEETFNKSLAKGSQSAKGDLERIRKEFNEFIDLMIEGD